MNNPERCPFCGSDKVSVLKEGGYYCKCNNCYATGSHEKTETEAINSWSEVTEVLELKDELSSAVIAWIKGRKNSSKWISVKDRLPELTQRMGKRSKLVLLYVTWWRDYEDEKSNHEKECHNVAIGWLSWSEKEKRCFWENVFNPLKYHEVVTHWMPLPKPPEEEKENGKQ